MYPQIPNFLTLQTVISPELEVGFWEYNGSLQPNEVGPSALIPPSLIKSQACRLTVVLPRARITVEEQALDGDEDDSEDTEPVGDERKAWVTIGLTRVSTFHFYRA